uniref:Uncharacterized protein n=1 Tax=Ananas comosus var. bracteatus TaxID=296719 RepID=A0A6V7PXY6_ANACO|nr:unnamed protein product [Ananas comosus var. bracteatus]
MDGLELVLVAARGYGTRAIPGTGLAAGRGATTVVDGGGGGAIYDNGGGGDYELKRNEEEEEEEEEEEGEGGRRRTTTRKQRGARPTEKGKRRIDLALQSLTQTNDPPHKGHRVALATHQYVRRPLSTTSLKR